MAPRSWFLAAPLGLALLICGCASVGEPLPPSLHIPARVIDLAAYQRGDKLIIDFTVPSTTTDGVGVRRLRDIELRAGPEGPNWETASKRIDTAQLSPGPVHLQIPAGEWAGREIAVRVRAQSTKGRYGEWSNTVRLKLLAPLGRPAVHAEPVPAGVRLNWAPDNAAGVVYRVFRSSPETPKPQSIGETPAPEYLDRQAQFGHAYTYTVQAAVKSGGSEVTSDISQPVTITPEDKFPPAVPSDVSAIAGVSSIDLSWSPNTEPDLRGYHLYRSVAGQAFTRVNGVLDAPSFSDRSIESGKVYRYEVSAIDQLGNESARSAPVEATAP